MTVLVVDVGGSHVKLLATGQPEPGRFDSQPGLTPDELVDGVRRATHDWPFDAASIGYPGKVGPGGPAKDPGNLGRGRVGFDVAAALGRPVRVVNDAAMQGLGGYDGRGRLLFLGLGTGLGPWSRAASSSRWTWAACGPTAGGRCSTGSASTPATGTGRPPGRRPSATWPTSNRSRRASAGAGTTTRSPAGSACGTTRGGCSRGEAARPTGGAAAAGTDGG